MAMIVMLKSRLIGATVTAADVRRDDTMRLSADLAQAAGFQEFERVTMSSLETGRQFEGYVHFAPAGEGIFQTNGPAAAVFQIGDRLTLSSYGVFDTEEAVGHKPMYVVVTNQNKIAENA